MPTIQEIWGLQLALDGKSPAGHQHRIAEIEGLAAALAAAANMGNNAAFIGDISGLQNALDSKASIDSLTGLQTQINARATAAALTATAGLQSQIDSLSSAVSTGNTTIAKVAGLQTALDGKAAVSHTHVIADVTGLQTALDNKAALAHTHANASSSAAGFMSAADKSKLDSLSSTGSSENTSPVLLTYTVSQSSVYGSATATYANVTDNNFSTGGGTNGQTDNWIAFTFANPTIFNRTTLGGATVAGFGGAAAYMNGGALEVSHDGTNWAILIQTIAGITDTAALTFAFSPITAKALRIRRQSYAAVGEFRIYG